MRLAIAALVLAATIAGTARGATPGTTLTVTTWLEGGAAKRTYTLTCAPATVRGLPSGALRPADACAALAEIGRRLYARRLSVSRPGCAYVQAPRGASITGTRAGRRVRTLVEVGACERLLVPLRTLRRVVAWPPHVR